MTDKVIVLPNVNIWSYASIHLHDMPLDIINFEKDENVTISLKNIKFLQPSGVVKLLLISRNIYKKTTNFVRICDMSNDILTYLQFVCFFEYDFVYTEQQVASPVLRNVLNFIKNKEPINAIKLRCLTKENEIASVVSKTREIMKKWSSTDNYIDSVSTILMEICGNSIEHSVLEGELPECYFILQCYFSGDTRVKIHIAIGDIGIGVKNHLVQPSDINKHDNHFIMKALRGLAFDST